MLVILPVVVEEVLNFTDQLFVERLASIKVGKQGQPLGKVAAITALVHISILVEDLDEAAHDEREDSHPH